MAVFGRSAVVSPAFKKQFYKELQTPFLIENNNKNNRKIEKNDRKLDPVFKNDLYKRQDFTAECRIGYKYENSQHLEISRIYVNGKCPYPRGKMNSKCPTPRAQKTGKSPTLSRGGDPRGFTWYFHYFGYLVCVSQNVLSMYDWFGQYIDMRAWSLVLCNVCNWLSIRGIPFTTLENKVKSHKICQAFQTTTFSWYKLFCEIFKFREDTSKYRFRKVP